MERAQGIDVNAWHPVKDFAALGAAGLSFVGVKATEGNTLTDKQLIRHRDGLRQLPLDLVIYYHFARTGSPTAQASRLLTTLGLLKPNERLCLDLEVLPDDPGDVLAWVNAFYERIRRACPGQRQLIYTSQRIWTQFGNPVWAAGGDIDLWAPRYGRHEPLMPAPWADWKIWQFTDGEAVPFTAPGVGPCDANVWNGTRADVAAWVAGSAALA